LLKLSDLGLLHLDVAGGIAGDMFIAACLDAFPELAEGLQALADHLLPQEAGQLTLFRDVNAGISCQRVELKQPEHKHHHAADAHHDHHHGHSHSHGHKHSAETTYIALKNRVETSGIDPSVSAIAVAILTILAKAEAKIHATDINNVHFHELADWDSLFDVVGAAYLIDALDSADWTISSLPVGSGLVKTQHGLIPVPAPATAEILLGFEFRDDGVAGERITPTGAAILKYLKTYKQAQASSCGKLAKTGYGGGARRLKNMPNILRVLAYQTETVNKPDALGDLEQVIQLNFDIDDMTGEEVAWAADKLRSESSLIDLSVSSARGKKNRQIDQINILVKESELESVIAACFRLTSTIGVRWQKLNRVCLVRTEHSVKLGDESFDIKQVKRPSESGELQSSCKVESDNLAQCRTLAQRRKIKQQIE